MMMNAVAAALLAAALTSPAHAAGGDSRDAFFANLGALCGATFEGASVFPRDPGDAFAGKKLTAHVANCSANEIRVPFIVGEDRSRTWVFTKTGAGLELKHDHRHADGTPDELTMYGGMASTGGSAHAQSFHADAYTAKLLPAASTNVWTVTMSPDGKTLTYALERDAKPRFKAELTRK